MVKLKFNISPITLQNQGKLIEIYKEVFSGHPWHEDKICLVCKSQYTSNPCERYDSNRLSGAIENDCREKYAIREGIFLLPENGLEKCFGCEQDLELADFYPDFVDHKKLIEESTKKPGFFGVMILDGEKTIGFTWGYQIPEKRTASVNFPAVRPMLLEKGLIPEKTFYGAETGVLDTYQNIGLGNAIVSKRVTAAKEGGFSYYVSRTINPYMHLITDALFSGEKGKLLFKDPERGSSWFSWNLEDFDPAQAKKRIECLA